MFQVINPGAQIPCDVDRRPFEAWDQPLLCCGQVRFIDRSFFIINKRIIQVFIHLPGCQSGHLDCRVSRVNQCLIADVFVG